MRATRIIQNARAGFMATPNNTGLIAQDAGQAIFTEPYNEVSFRAGTAGTIRFTPADNPMANDSDATTAITLTFVAGEWYPGSVKKIWATGTTSTGIYAGTTKDLI
jgi:hypothetical protein